MMKRLVEVFVCVCAGVGKCWHWDEWGPHGWLGRKVKVHMTVLP